MRTKLSASVISPQTGSSRQSLIWPLLSPDGRQLIIPTIEGAVFVYQVVP
jgi:hypothetical protein